MRFPNLFLSLTLVFIIQFSSVQTQSIIGTWSNLKILYESSSLCCIPNSIKIEKDPNSQSLVATYNIPAIYMNQRCLRMFGSVTRATIDLKMQSTDSYLGKSTQTGMGSGSFYFKVTSDSKLRIYQSNYDLCDFTFSLKTGGSKSNPDPDEWSVFFGCEECMEGLFFLVFAIISCCVSCWKKIGSLCSDASPSENNTSSFGLSDNRLDVQVASGDALVAYNANQQQAVGEENYFAPSSQNNNNQKTNSGLDTPYVL